ncbi:MAG: DUF3800 domain-containing protein [Chloroflexi bacterium]|nr:DUF3800 domain-containing protein [Chloroflexota bacterium]
MTGRYPYRYSFVDETGNLGFAFDRGSTPYFAILLLLLNDPEPLRIRIDWLKKQLDLPEHIEFKFHKTSDTNRRAFLAALAHHPFVGRALVVDKRQLPEAWRNTSDSRFYASCFAELADRIPNREVGETILVLDQFGSPVTTLRELRRSLKTHNLGRATRLFKKITMKRSKGENLIQCADMVAGAMMRAWRGGDNSYFDLVRDKVIIWEYPGNENPPS